jgi:hypothetical protein
MRRWFAFADISVTKVLLPPVRALPTASMPLISGMLTSMNARWMPPRFSVSQHCCPSSAETTSNGIGECAEI